MEAFAWLGQIIESVGRLIPRLLLVRATHMAVKWRHGHTVKALHPGLHIYWPIVSEIDQIVVARQTSNLPTQVLMTSDGVQIVIGCLVVYRIRDAVLAIGEKNWDVEGTILDIAMGAVAEIIAGSTLEELVGVAGGVEKKLTATTRKRLRQFGVFVQRVAVTDFSTTRTYRLIGDCVKG